MNKNHRDRATLLALGAIAALANHPALAQEAPAAASRAEEMETVTVTGSRIRRADYSSDSPVVTVESRALTETGSTAMEHVLNTLPQFVPSVTTTSNNPGNGGQANIDLRGLGTQRNLVLLNGRRLPPSNPTGTVDVNIVPSALIESIEVVTGGASAVYGSDAIAGVTNFTLKRDFQGVAFESGYGQTDRSDGAEWTSSLTLGSNFADDRGNAVFSFQYTERDAIYQGARDFSRVSYDVRRAGNTPLGSGTSIEGRFDRDNLNLPTQAAFDTVFARYGAAAGSVSRAQGVGFNPDGTLFTYGTGLPGTVANYRGDTGSASFSDASFTYNFAPANAMQLPLQRWNVSGFGTFALGESVEAYAQAFLTSYEVTSTLAPTPATGLEIPVTNPFIPDDLADILASRPDPTARFNYRQRMLGVGPRETSDQYDVYQLLAGVRGKLGAGWNWDIYAATSRMSDNTVLDNDISLSRIQELLDAPDGGVDDCAGGYNPFTGPAGMSSECAQFVKSYFTNRTRLDSSVIEATLGGKAFTMPVGEAQFSVGTSWREESFDFAPDLAVARGDLVGFNQQSALEGAFHVTDLFGELYLPLASEAKFARELGVTVGARLSEHSLAGSSTSYKVEGNWRAIDSLRFRASFQRAVRAPSIAELFSPANENFPTIIEDPCSNTSAARAFGSHADVANGGDGAVRNLCIQQGIPATDIDDYNVGAAQIGTQGGGNPDLSEEKADTVTLGAVFEMGGLRASIDWYSIKLADAIFSIPANEIVLLCYGYSGNNQELDANDPACRALDRRTTIDGKPSDGTPWVPSQGTANVSSLRTSGVDLQVDYGFEMGAAGKLDLNLLGNVLAKWELSYLPGLPLVDYKGTVGDVLGSAYPDYKLLFNARWQLRQFGAGLRLQYLPAMDNKYASYDPFTTVGTPATTYVDANLSWKPAELFEMRLGVENLTDEAPPQYTAGVQMNTDPSTFDVLGRRYFFRANFKF